jgi:hypothetical protein
MPPLSVSREFLETTETVQRDINRWEPRVAAGGDLLPIPTRYALDRVVVFDGTGGFDEGTTSRSTIYETRMDFDGRVLDQYSFYSGQRGIYEQGDNLDRRIWLDNGRFICQQIFGHRVDDRSQVPEGKTKLTEHVTQVVDDKTIAWVHSEPDNEGRNMWVTRMHDTEGYHHIFETFDDEGKLVDVVHNITNKKGDGDHLTSVRTEYTYSASGNLTKEHKVLAWDGKKPNDEKSETTKFYYLPSGIVSHVTTLGDGTEIRRGTRYYDEEGRFLRAEIVENLPGEHRERRVTQTAQSYAPIQEPLQPAMW